MNTITMSPNVTCLVVEDAPKRNEWFASVLPHFDIAETPKVALAMLALHHYDIVFLDHDCRVDAHGVRTFVEPTDEDFLDSTFWRVAQRLAGSEAPVEDQPQVVIHSGNPVGANRMAALIRSVNPRVYVMPFGSFEIKIDR